LSIAGLARAVNPSHFFGRQKLNGMTTYKLNPNANINGTYKVATLQTTFGQLVAVFGMPEESDGYKSSGDWLFTSDDGDTFTIYDWKATSLYDSSLPSVEEFRSSPKIVEFSVGGQGDASEFLSWVSHKLNEEAEPVPSTTASWRTLAV
jgi:hypothetical protein